MQGSGDFPISAASVEFLAFSIAIRAMGASQTGNEKATIVTDCAAVLNGFNHQQRHFGYRSKYAGLWREEGFCQIAKVEKMAAHLTQEQAKHRSLGHNWEAMTRLTIGAKGHLIVQVKKERQASGTSYKSVNM